MKVIISISHPTTLPGHEESTSPSTMATRAPSMQRLPAELLTQIAEAADPKDLLALRLTCRATSAAAFEAFRSAFFTRRSHLYTRFGLQALADIAAQPYLIKELNEVKIIVIAIDEDRFPSNKTNTVYLAAPMSVPRGQNIPKKTLNVRQLWTEDQNALNHLGCGPMLLARMLHDLAAAGIVPAVTVCGSCMTDELDHSAFYGCATLLKEFANVVDLDHFTDTRSDDAVSSLFQAILTSRSPIKDLTLLNYGGTDDVVRRHLRDHVPRGVATNGGPSALTGLTSLSLCFSDRVESWSLGDARAFAEVFARATSLQHLVLSWREVLEMQHHGSMVSPVGNAFGACALASLDLRDCSTGSQALIRFLQLFKGSLKSLALASVAISEEECWGGLLHWIADNLQLDHVNLVELAREETVMQLKEDDDIQEYDIRGVDEVKGGLMALAERPQYVSHASSASEVDSEDLSWYDKMCEMEDRMIYGTEEDFSGTR